MNIIQINDLVKSFGAVKALQGINFDVNKGEITGFLGPNGAGKTTTIGIMMQFIKQDKGSVRIFDQDVRNNIVEIKKRIGLIADASLPSIRGDKFLKHTAMYGKYRGGSLKKRINEVIELIGGKSFYLRNTKTLSRGQKQRLIIANALINDPELLIADEPTSGLDPISRNSLLKLFQKLCYEEGKSIFFSNHVISEVEKISNKIIMLSQGKIVSMGRLDEIISSLPITNTYTLEAEGIDVKYLQQLPSIEHVEVLRQNKYIIKSNEDTNNSTPDFLKELVNNDKIIVHQFSRDILELEDYFMEVTSNGE